MRFELILLLCHSSLAMAFASPLAADEPKTEAGRVDTDAEQSSLELTVATIRSAVSRSIPHLEEGSRVSATERKCFTCHNQALPVLALTAARQRGFQVDAENLQRQITHTWNHLSRGRKSYGEGRGQGGQVMTAGYALWTLEAAGHAPDETTQAVAHYLLKYQSEQGYWSQRSQRPPSSGSSFTATAVALRGLAYAGHGIDQSELHSRKTRVTQWLGETIPETTEDHVFRLRALASLGASAERVQRAIDELLALQDSAGGWAQTPDMEPDAYATGSVLCGLIDAGQLAPRHPQIQAGCRYLLETQREDGTWHVVTRAKPIQEYYESGFPHDEDQFVSITATGWSTLALLLQLTEGSDGATAELPRLDKTDLFSAGQSGYETFRVPGIVVTREGSVLAYCEARRGSRSDWADIEILLCRSDNGGRTWSPPQRIADSGKDTVNNPVAIVDQDTGRIHFLYCVNYHRCFSMFSDDDGRTFSTPREITETFAAFREHYAWNVLATGPGHGIQLRNGRLLVPVWLSTATREHRPSAVSVIFSDDRGQTWEAGEIVCEHPDPLINPSETIAVELSDGRVQLNIRNENRDYLRAISSSSNGATDWSPVEVHKQLYEPICMAGLIQLPPPFADNRATFVFTNPHSELNPKQHGRHNFRYRENVTVRLSSDDCVSWPISRVLEAGISGYTDLAVGHDGTIYCIYERGGENGMAFRHLTLARFNRAWIEAASSHTSPPPTPAN